MNEKNLNEEMENTSVNEELDPDNASNLQDEQTNASEEMTDADNVTDDCARLQQKYDDLNDSHLRLMAEFDNYRKRTLREKAEILKNGGENILTNLLPVIDDFERAMQIIQTAEDIKAVTEGVELIYNKFKSFLSHQGVKPIETIGLPFDMETSEAVAIIPAAEEDVKGKVVDCVQTGYILNDKVIRHAKVVVAE